jgi:hypothetical protein
MSFEIQKSKVLIQLLKAPIYRDSSPVLWQELLKHKENVSEYFSHLGLAVFLHEDFGFAFLKQDIDSAEMDEEQTLPRLIQQRELSFELSVLLALFRKQLAEHDRSSADLRLVLDERDILQMMKIFLPDTNNEVAQKKEVGGLIEKAIDIGILRRMSHDPRKLEVLRILAALFDASRLNELDQRLEEYKDYAQQPT